MAQRYVMSPEGGLPLPYGTLGDDLSIAYAEPTETLIVDEPGGGAALPTPVYLQSRDVRLREIQHARRAMGVVEQARANLAQGPGSIAPFVPPPELGAPGYGPGDGFLIGRPVGAGQMLGAPVPGPEFGAPGYGPRDQFTVPRTTPTTSSRAAAAAALDEASYGGTIAPGLRQPFDAVDAGPVSYAEPIIGPLPTVESAEPARPAARPPALPFVPSAGDYTPTGRDWSGGAHTSARAERSLPSLPRIVTPAAPPSQGQGVPFGLQPTKSSLVQLPVSLTNLYAPLDEISPAQGAGETGYEFFQRKMKWIDDLS